MALTLGDNFSYQGAKPLDGRLNYSTVAEMKAVADATMYDGCMAYCSATDKTYQWKSSNTVDPDTGKWREFSSGGGGGTTDYEELENKPQIEGVELEGDVSASDLGLQKELTEGDGIDITNDTISIDPMPAEDMDDVIDELPTGGNIAVTGYVPLATIIQYYGETPPDFFLACDGSTYNKADYPELAKHLLSLTNNTPYIVDGDNTKFKVPDLRGEFIRGTGSNSHENQGSGSNVGVHQDATIIPHFQVNVKDSTTNNVYFGTDATTRGVGNADKNIMSATGGYADYSFNRDSQINRTGSQAVQHTTRPTNTSVLFCIAYKDIYSNPMNDYSTDEKVVGTWVNGKPIYQRTIAITDFSAVNTADRSWYALYTSPSNNYDRVFGVINEGTFLQYTDNGANWSISPNEYLNHSGSVPVYNALRANCNNGMLVISLLNCGATPYRSTVTYTNRVLYVTVRYTKTTD